MDLPIGTIVGSKYKLGKPIGFGACGKLYEGTDVNSSKTVAIKVANELGIGMIANEVRMYSKLDGIEGIPKMMWHGKECDKSILVIERLGSTISEMIIKNVGRPFRLEKTLCVAKNLVRVIRRMHSQNIIHSDIHTGNVMMGTEKNENIVYLIDFGLAKVLDDITTSRKPQCWIKQDLIDAGVVFQKLIPGSSEEVTKYMNHCSQLQEGETPDYDYIENIFGNKAAKFL